VSFERVSIPALDAHVSEWPLLDCCGCVFCNGVEGFGAALLDVDGDLDLDLFVGSRVTLGNGSDACTYLNESDGVHAFRRSSCDEALRGATSGVATDFDEDGVHELLALGPRIVMLAHDGGLIDLLDELSPDDPRRQCVASSAVVTDLDLDGRLDLYVGCQLERLTGCCSDDPDGWRNIAWLQRGSGQWEPAQGAAWDVLADPGVTLAIGQHDVNGDGFPDLLVANDTFNMLGDPANRWYPGSVLLRCGPTEGCIYRRVEFGVEAAAWGSFMGFGAVVVDGAGEQIYVSDWGTNRLVRFEEGVPVESSVDRGVDLTAIEGGFLFGWGVVVDDFDRNGLDDIYVAQGDAWPGPAPDSPDQHDEVLLQAAGGEFHRYSAAQLGLALHDPSDARTEDSMVGSQSYSSRGAVRADLDGDGRMEILTGGLAGVLRVQEETAPDDSTEPGRCTLVPKPSVVPGFGTGFAVSGLAEGSGFRTFDIQGQFRFGGSPWLMTRFAAGFVRFPSGAVVPFDCRGGNGPVVVEEDEWVTIEWESASVTVQLDRPGGEPSDVRVAVRAGGGDVVVSSAARRDGGWTIPLGPSAESIMLELDGRWVPRWWDRL
jgi:hypothetical protein